MKNVSCIVASIILFSTGCSIGLRNPVVTSKVISSHFTYDKVVNDNFDSKISQDGSTVSLSLQSTCVINENRIRSVEKTTVKEKYLKNKDTAFVMAAASFIAGVTGTVLLYRTATSRTGTCMHSMQGDSWTATDCKIVGGMLTASAAAMIIPVIAGAISANGTVTSKEIVTVNSLNSVNENCEPINKSDVGISIGFRKTDSDLYLKDTNVYIGHTDNEGLFLFDLSNYMSEDDINATIKSGSDITIFAGEKSIAKLDKRKLSEYLCNKDWIKLNISMDSCTDLENTEASCLNILNFYKENEANNTCQSQTTEALKLLVEAKNAYIARLEKEAGEKELREKEAHNNAVRKNAICTNARRKEIEVNSSCKASCKNNPICIGSCNSKYRITSCQ